MSLKEGQMQKAIELQNMKQILTSVNDKIESMPGKTIIKEVSNPLTMTPLECLSLRTEFISKAPLNEFSKYPVTIDNVKEGNMQVQDGSILLKANKTYELNLEIQLVPTKTGYSHVNLRDDANDSIITALSFNGDYYNNTCGTRPFSSTIYTPSKDMLVNLGLHYPSSEGLKISVRLNIQEIRNNPVNQYGGFETQVLFDGEINKGDEVTLSESVLDYNYVHIIKEYRGEISVVPIMTSNTTPSPYVITVSSESTNDHKYTGCFAFNGKIGNGSSAVSDCWASGDGTGPVSNAEWIQVDCGSKKAVSKFNISSRRNLGDAEHDGVPTSIIIYGSNDGLKYETIYLNDNFDIKIQETKEISLHNDVEYRYYKFEFQSTTHRLVCISEISLIRFTKKSISKILTLMSEYTSIVENGIEVIRVDGHTLYNSGETMHRVIGVKGQLPSLLNGGEF